MKFVKWATMLVIEWKVKEIKNVRSETQRLLKLVGTGNGIGINMKSEGGARGGKGT